MTYPHLDIEILTPNHHFAGFQNLKNGETMVAIRKSDFYIPGPIFIATMTWAIVIAIQLVTYLRNCDKFVTSAKANGLDPS